MKSTDGDCGAENRYERLFGNDVKMVAEPGRGIVGDAMILVTRVISESVRDGRNWLYFDDGTFGSFMEVLLYRMRFPMKTNTTGAPTGYVLARPTCDSIDVFSRDVTDPEIAPCEQYVFAWVVANGDDLLLRCLAFPRVTW
ncbi:MAG: hypothetical protein KAY24_07330 [Candidatus Eisenbacteria sp.]|nr:hypothetical protein [Candidatus Eisenbacteria bacterium]